MIGMTIKTNGLDENIRRFRRLHTNIPGKTSRKCVTDVARWVQKSAKLRAPVKTGMLRENIRVVVNSNNRAVVTADVPYSGAMEEGAGLPMYALKFERYTSRTRGAYLIMKGSPGPKPPASVEVSFVRRYKPFILPAVEACRMNLPNIVDPIIKNEVTK